MLHPLDGPATGGFNNDISTVPPSEVPPRRTSSLRKGDRSTPSSPVKSTRQLSRLSQLASGDRSNSSEAREIVDGETALAQEEVGSTTEPAGVNGGAALAPDTSPSASNSDDGNGGADTPEQLLEKATSTVTGLRMRILRFTPSYVPLVFFRGVCKLASSTLNASPAVAIMSAFTPISSWFSVTMGTGIVNVLLFLLPWSSTHAVFRDIGAAFWVLDVAIFIFFAGLTIARYTLYPTIFMAMVSHPVHSLFLGTIPMGFVTIVTGMATLGNEYGIAGSVEAAAGLWWFALVLSIATSAMVPFTMQTLHQHTSDSMTAAWLLPVVPPITIAASSGVISNLLIDSDPDYALKIWIAGYVVNGVGLLVAGMILTLYYQRLSLYHLPGREVIISTFLPLGPCGQGGYALLLAGRNARLLFPIIASRNPDNDLSILAEVGPALYAIGISASLLLWGLGMWFFILAIASIISHRIRGTIVFGMGWWSLTFPIGSLNLLTYGLGTAFDSMFFKVLGTVMTALVVFNWAAVFFPTLKGWWTGSLFQAPCLVKLPDLLNRSQGEKSKDKEMGRT